MSSTTTSTDSVKAATMSGDTLSSVTDTTTTTTTTASSFSSSMITYDTGSNLEPLSDSDGRTNPLTQSSLDSLADSLPTYIGLAAAVLAAVLLLSVGGWCVRRRRRAQLLLVNSKCPERQGEEWRVNWEPESGRGTASPVSSQAMEDKEEKKANGNEERRTIAHDGQRVDEAWTDVEAARAKPFKIGRGDRKTDHVPQVGDGDCDTEAELN